jgi:hypothetical protein
VFLHTIGRAHAPISDFFVPGCFEETNYSLAAGGSMSKDFYNLADLNPIPIIPRRNSFFLNGPIKRANQFFIQRRTDVLP